MWKSKAQRVQYGSDSWKLNTRERSGVDVFKKGSVMDSIRNRVIRKIRLHNVCGDVKRILREGGKRFWKR